MLDVERCIRETKLACATVANGAGRGVCPAVAVTDLNRSEAPHYPFMALSDRITVYNF